MVIEGAIALANGKLSSLKRLYLLFNEISDKGTIALAKLSNLEYLHLHGSRIDNEGAKTELTVSFQILNSFIYPLTKLVMKVQ